MPSLMLQPNPVPMPTFKSVPDAQGTPNTLADEATRQPAPAPTAAPHVELAKLVESTRGPGGGYSLGRKAEEITVADIIVAVDEPIDATGCAGKENCMGDDAGRCMTHDLWASLNSKMIEFLDSVSLRKLVDEQLAKGVSIEEHPVKRAISSQPVVKPIKITAPNSVFALGAAFTK